MVTKKSEDKKPRARNGKGDKLRIGADLSAFSRGYDNIDKNNWKDKWAKFKRERGGK